MKVVIDNLKSKEIIYQQSIDILKNYIDGKYPGENDAFRARVFADAVHKIIDDHIKEFRRNDQRAIKKELLTSAIDNNSFEISAYDIMKTCVNLEIDEESFMEDLNSWLNHQQEVRVHKDALHELTSLVKEEIVRESQQVQEPDLNALYDEVYTSPQHNLDALIEEATLGVTIEEDNTRSSDIDKYFEEEYDLDQVEVGNNFEADLMAQLEAAFAGIGDDEPTVKETVVFDDYGDEPEAAVDALFVSEAEKPGSGALNMFNLADTIYEDDTEETEDEAEVAAEEPNEEFFDTEPRFDTDEERPVIKIERESQLEVVNQEPEEIPEPERLSMKKYISEWFESGKYKHDLKMALPFLVGFVVLVIVLYTVLSRIDFSDKEPEPEPASTSMVEIIEDTEIALSIEPAKERTITREKRADAMDLHESIRHKEIDEAALCQWLERRNSMLAEEKYFDIVLEVAEDYGVNPLLLFAITGQEQNFVQKDHEDAALMIKNPFNVYGSWQKYNTDLRESAMIASRTIHTHSEGLPEGMNPVEWINRGYAEDEKWHVGVSVILEQLEAVAGH